MYQVLVTFCVLFSGAFAKLGSLPDAFPRCKLNDTRYDECLAKATQESFLLLRKGIPSLGVLPIDPLQISELSMVQGSGPARFNMKLINAVVHGFSNVKVITAQNDLPRGGFDMNSEVVMPEIKIMSNYKLQGRVMFLPVLGEGRCNFTIRDAVIHSTLENEKISKNGEEYIKVKNFIFKVNPGKIFLHFDNLFRGDRELSSQMNVFLNEHSKEIFEDVSPAVEEAFGEIFKQLSNRILLKVPYKTIFLTD